jgi:hypothetical protein
MTNAVDLFSGATAVIRWPMGATVPDLYCPVTGKVVAYGQDYKSGEERMGEEPDYKEIEGLLFIYLPEVGEFAYLKDGLEEKLNDIRTELSKGEATADEDEDIEDDFFLIQDNIGQLAESPLMYCMETSGMACGPVSSEVYFGFDLFAPFAKFYD